MQKADFHTHSTASDGTLAPAALVEESARRGLSHIALTDHDTTHGVAEAVAAGERHGVFVVPGIELSAKVERGELHILGYGIDIDNDDLQAALEHLRQTRHERAERIVERLHALGIDLPDHVLAATSEESIGRPHIARALMELGVVDSVSEGFEKYLGWGRPAFVSKALIQPEEAIDLIRNAGGIAIMAHPFSTRLFRTLVPRLIEAGLSGIECYYGEYDTERRAELVAFADDLGVLKSGGSDYHGPAFREGRDLGSVDIPEETISALLKACCPDAPML